jgi:hypothetical protein
MERDGRETDKGLFFLLEYLSKTASPIEDLWLDVCRGVAGSCGKLPEWVQSIKPCSLCQQLSM